MPRYYFNIHTGTFSLSDQGVELTDVAAAREEALRCARALIAEQALLGKISLHHRIEVEDEDRRPVFMLPFKAAVDIETERQVVVQPQPMEAG